MIVVMGGGCGSGEGGGGVGCGGDGGGSSVIGSGGGSCGGKDGRLVVIAVMMAVA